MDLEKIDVFQLPQEVLLEKPEKVPQKIYLSMEFKPAIRKKIKEQVLSMTITHQFTGKFMPVLVEEEYNVQVIQFIDFYVKDVKKAQFLGELFQSFIKNPCVLRIYDDQHECFSLALKRLNLNDKTKVVVTDILMTPIFLHRFPDSEERKLAKELNFQNIKATLNMQTYYRELFLRCYFQAYHVHYKAISDWETLWYSPTKAFEVYLLLKEIVELSAKKKKTKEMGELAEINMEIIDVQRKIDGMR